MMKFFWNEVMKPQDYIIDSHWC